MLADIPSIGALQNISGSQDVLQEICSVLTALFELQLHMDFAFQDEG